MIDVAFSTDYNIRNKEHEKLEKYFLLIEKGLKEEQ